MPGLIELLILIIATGIALGLINLLIPMAPLIKSLLNLLVFVILIIYILQFFGLINPVLPFPRFMR